MGDVTVLQPVAETIEFSEEGAAECDYIQLKMIHAARKLTGVSLQIDETNDELKQLQVDYYHARREAEIVVSICEAANEQRARLWTQMPDGKPCIIIAVSDQEYVFLAAQRRYATILCSRFKIVRVQQAA